MHRRVEFKESEVWRSRQGELKGQTNGGKCKRAREILKHLPSAKILVRLIEDLRSQK